MVGVRVKRELYLLLDSLYGFVVSPLLRFGHGGYQFGVRIYFLVNLIFKKKKIKNSWNNIF